MTLHEFISKYSGQSVLYNQKNPALRGECVQLACFYAEEVLGTPVVWANAANWWNAGGYQKVGVSELQAGDLVIWQSTLPGSGGAGHIGIYYYKTPNGFVSFDSNWGGRYCHLVTHNYEYVLGGLRKPQTNTQGSKEVIIGNGENWYARMNRLHHQLVRNGDLPREIFNQIVGQEVWRVVEQWSDHPEAGRLIQLQELGEVASRDNWEQQIYGWQDTAKKQQELINTQNQTITDLQTKLRDSELTNEQKLKVLNEAIAKMSETTNQMETTQDIAKDTGTPPEPVDSPSLLVKILAALFKKR